MKNGLSFEESKKPVDRDTANDKELQAALVLKEFCAERNCPGCKFEEIVKVGRSYYNQCLLSGRPPEYWRLDIKRGGSNGQI